MTEQRTSALDLGCGQSPKNLFNADDVYGIDIRSSDNPRVYQADLAIEKIPFSDEFFDYITAHDFIEHVPRVIYNPHRRTPFIALMNEIWRTLKPGGRFLSQTPAYPQPATFWDPTHVNFITEQTFPMYFCGSEIGKAYGFEGNFQLFSQDWHGPHLVTVLIK